MGRGLAGSRRRWWSRCVALFVGARRQRLRRRRRSTAARSGSKSLPGNRLEPRSVPGNRLQAGHDPGRPPRAGLDHRRPDRRAHASARCRAPATPTPPTRAARRRRPRSTPSTPSTPRRSTATAPAAAPGPAPSPAPAGRLGRATTAVTAPAAAVACAAQGGELPEALALAAFSQQPGIALAAGTSGAGDIHERLGPERLRRGHRLASGRVDFSSRPPTPGNSAA